MTAVQHAQYIPTGLGFAPCPPVGYTLSLSVSPRWDATDEGWMRERQTTRMERDTPCEAFQRGRMQIRMTAEATTWLPVFRNKLTR